MVCGRARNSCHVRVLHLAGYLQLPIHRQRLWGALITQHGPFLGQVLPGRKAIFSTGLLLYLGCSFSAKQRHEIYCSFVDIDNDTFIKNRLRKVQDAGFFIVLYYRETVAQLP